MEALSQGQNLTIEAKYIRKLKHKYHKLILFLCKIFNNKISERKKYNNNSQNSRIKV